MWLPSGRGFKTPGVGEGSEQGAEPPCNTRMITTRCPPYLYWAAWPKSYVTVNSQPSLFFNWVILEGYLFFVGYCLCVSLILGGVRLRHHCLENCVLTCYWGCAVHGLQKALWDHEQGVLITTPLQFEQALRGSYQHQGYCTSRERSEILCRLPGDSSVQDAGSLSTARYPFVALLTLEQPDKRELYEIVASVSVIHISHENFRLPSRLLYQYLLTAQGHVYDLKQLFMSANHRSRAEDSDLFCKGKEQQQEGDERATTATAASSSEEEGSVRGDRDCVVCQNAPVNQVLLPCRHTCLCDSCVERFHQCPVCRANIWESFALYQKTLHYGDRA
uniref:Cell growth regulator with RING finger domain protein 1 n=1 Tax=Erpetoichthys calabaricus TaxID=27687 RepID=A0A8C4SQ27_ERPCA